MCPRLLKHPVLYYCVQWCIASSNNNNLDTKSHLFTEIALVMILYAMLFVTMNIVKNQKTKSKRCNFLASVEGV